MYFVHISLFLSSQKASRKCIILNIGINSQFPYEFILIDTCFLGELIEFVGLKKKMRASFYCHITGVLDVRQLG